MMDPKVGDATEENEPEEGGYDVPRTVVDIAVETLIWFGKPAEVNALIMNILHGLEDILC